MLHAELRRYGKKHYAIIRHDVFNDGTYVYVIGVTDALSLKELKHRLHGKNGIAYTHMTRSKPA